MEEFRKPRFSIERWVFYFFSNTEIMGVGPVGDLVSFRVGIRTLLPDGLICGGFPLPGPVYPSADTAGAKCRTLKRAK